MKLPWPTKNRRDLKNSKIRMQKSKLQGRKL
jgi:hypothetical protein